MAWRADFWAVGSLALGMEALFLASDWITGLAQWIFVGRLRGGCHWKAPWGWGLGLSGALFVLLPLFLIPNSQRLGLGLVLALWALLSAKILWMRIKLPPRNIVLMMSSALLLTGPALVLGGLAFGTWGLKALGYWALWAWFFIWGVNYVQVWMRGNTLPRWRSFIASLPFLLEAAALGLLASWHGVLVLVLLSGRIVWRLWQRLGMRENRAILHTLPRDIRLLGFEQVAWSFCLSAVWIIYFLPGH
jgi:hypothetical protein